MKAWKRGIPALSVLVVATAVPVAVGVAAAPAGSAAPPASGAPATQSAPEGSSYRPIDPVRLLDATGPSPVALGPRGTTTVQVTGVGGVPVDGVSAVLVNLTGSQATQSTTITVTAAGSAAPATANLTLPLLLRADNLAIAAVGQGGRVAIHNEAGRVNVGLDLIGWFAQQSDLATVPPSRLVDTRNGAAPDTPVRGGSPLQVPVTNRAGVPATGVGMVIVNVTALDATTLTSLKVSASGSAAPAQPNLDVLPLVPAASLAVVPVGANGAIAVANTSGRVNVIVDILGWLPSTSDAHLVPPTALLDTRPDRWSGRLGGGASLDVQVAGRAGVPSTGVVAVILSVSGSRATRATALTVHPTGRGRPVPASVQVPPILPAENLVVVPLGSDGKVRVHNAAGSVHVAVDVHGWFSEPSAPTDGSWAFRPDSVMLTSAGDSATVELVHLDVDGHPTGAQPPPGISVVTHGDASSLQRTEIGRGRYLLTASDQVGYLEIDATVPGFDPPATVRVSNLRLRDGVAVVDSDRVVVPAPDGSAAISGPFTEGEVRSRITVPPSDGDPFDDDIRLPVVLRGSPPAPGTLVISADGLAFAGQVVEPPGLPTVVRDGHSLLSLATVSPFDVFREVRVASSGSVRSIDSSGSGAGIGPVPTQLGGGPGRSVPLLAQAGASCETEAAAKAVELTAGVTQFAPSFRFDAGGNPEAGNSAVTVGVSGDITVEFELSLQLAREVTLECTLREFPAAEIAPPGIGAVLSAFFEFAIEVAVDVKGTLGPRVSMGFSCSQHFGYEAEVTYDRQLGLHHRPRNTTTPASCTPKFDVAADPAAITIEANAGLFAAAKVGARAGGAFAAWAERAGLEDVGKVQLLKFRAGPRLHGVWENEAKVLASEDTESTLGVEILVDGAIDLEIPGQSSGVGVFDRLAQWISGDPTAEAEITFLELQFPAVTLYRPPAPRPGGLEIRVDGELRASDQAVEVAPGDRVEVRAGVDRKGPSPLFGDAPITRGTAHRKVNGLSGPFDALALEVLEQGGGGALLHGTLDVLPALCDDAGGAAKTIQLLAHAPMLGVLPTTGFAGTFSLKCAGPRLEFDRASVDFRASEVDFPATAGLIGFDLDGWEWSLTGLQSWLHAEPTSGVFDSEEEREPIVLTVDCSEVDPPAMVSHILVATASSPGREPKEARLPVSADCRQEAEIDVPGQVVLETWSPVGLPNDPNRCITVQFLEFPASEDATSYTAVVLNHVLGVNQTFTAAPNWPADSYTVFISQQHQHTFTAPGGSHRMVLGSESSGSGCDSSPRFTLVSLKARVG